MKKRDGMQIWQGKGGTLESQSEWSTVGYTDRHTEIQTETHRETQTDRDTNRQRHTDRQRHILDKLDSY